MFNWSKFGTLIANALAKIKSAALIYRKWDVQKSSGRFFFFHWRPRFPAPFIHSDIVPDNEASEERQENAKDNQTAEADDPGGVSPRTGVVAGIEAKVGTALASLVDTDFTEISTILATRRRGGVDNVVVVFS